MEQSTIALIILAITLVLFATELFPVCVTAIMSSVAMALTGIISYQQVVLGLSNNVVVFVFGLATIGNAMSETGAAQHLGHAIMRHYHGSEKMLLMLLILLAGVFSMFMSNTTSIVLFMSIVASMAAGSRGRITAKGSYMAMGIATVAGGGCTLIGSTTQLAAQGLLIGYGVRPMAMFDLMKPGIFVFAALLLYYYFIGYDLQKKVLVEAEADPGTAQEAMTIPQGAVSLKTWTPMIILAVCIALTIVGWANIAIVAILGALACVVTKCISVQKMFAQSDWNTIIMIAGSIGFAAGIEKSGAGALMASTAIDIVGSSTHPWAYLAALVCIGTIMTNIMANISTVVILTPIAFSLAQQMGCDPMPFMIGVIWAANMPYSTPIGASVITMTMTAGYRFKDYTKIGLPYNIVACAVVIISVPLLFKFH